MNYSKDELVNMVYAIGEAHGNCVLAARIYKANYPDLERYPRVDCFTKLKERFQRTANANYEKTTRTHASCNEENQINIVSSVIQNPQISVREVSDEIRISKSIVHRTLKKHKFYPYRIQKHQFLFDQDVEKRMQFCQWAQATYEEDHNFFSTVLFTDESSFANSGRVNSHNFHHYADHNPRIIRQVDHQHRFKVNVWAGICGEHVIGPHFFQGNLNGNMYLQFLQNDLQILQRQIPDRDLNRQWFQHDGAPPHSTVAVREYLNDVYVDRWIGRGGPITCPPRSPDLTCLDFFLWGFIKDKVYQTPPADVEDLKTRIRNAFTTISPEVLQDVASNFHMRIALCIENNGRHFEHLLQ